MSMLEHFQRLFAYDEWANREVLDSLSRSGTARSLELMAHIISAEHLWFERIRGNPQPFPVWPDFSLEQCAAEAANSAALWKSYLAQSSELALAQTITYKNTTGESWSSRIEDVVMHVIMHSAYHRGQIAADTRSAGMVPAYTDFIHAVRQGFVE
jgi:uncharacterized damage-inducible protein DinB